jgi:hypothetical protein
VEMSRPIMPEGCDAIDVVLWNTAVLTCFLLETELGRALVVRFHECGP